MQGKLDGILDDVAGNLAGPLDDVAGNLAGPVTTSPVPREDISDGPPDDIAGPMRTSPAALATTETASPSHSS